jgi:sarcosine oxidase
MLALPPSLWAASAAPAVEAPALVGESRTEVAVIGGGFTGLAAALHLAEAGKAVVLLESGEPGWGASGRNGGQVIPGLKLDPDDIVAKFGPERGERIVAIAGGGADLVFALIARHGIACDARRNGWIQALASAKHIRLAERRVRQWRQRGAEVRLLDRAETARRLGTDRYHGAWLDPRGGSVQPLSYARGLARAAAAAGAAIHGGSPARRLTRRNGKWLVETPQGTVIAEQVVVGTNAYTDDLVPGLKRTLIPVASFQIATQPLSENVRRTILPGGEVVSDTRRLLAYFRLDRDGRLLVGGRGTPEGEADAAKYARIRKMLAWLFPHVTQPEIVFHWGGKVALTADHLPHVHEPEPGLHIAVGYNGRGIAMATMMGKLLAERVLGAPAEVYGLPVTPIRPLPFWSLRAPALADALDT